jgi:hypothetical protein
MTATSRTYKPTAELYMPLHCSWQEPPVPRIAAVALYRGLMIIQLNVHIIDIAVPTCTYVCTHNSETLAVNPQHLLSSSS